MESGGPRGYEAGKKVKGRKRQALVDQPWWIKPWWTWTGALLSSIRSLPAYKTATGRCRSYACRVGPSPSSPKPSPMQATLASVRPAPRSFATIITVEIVRKPPDQVGFAVHPRRWVVERFFAWVSRNRRLWKDPEATLSSAKTFLYAAAVMILVRRIARAP